MNYSLMNYRKSTAKKSYARTSFFLSCIFLTFTAYPLEEVRNTPGTSCLGILDDDNLKLPETLQAALAHKHEYTEVICSCFEQEKNLGRDDAEVFAGIEQEEKILDRDDAEVFAGIEQEEKILDRDDAEVFAGIEQEEKILGRDDAEVFAGIEQEEKILDRDYAEARDNLVRNLLYAQEAIKSGDFNIPRENLCSTLANYIPQNESQEKAKKAVEKLVGYNDMPSLGLFLSGTVGVGKSHLAHAAAKEILFNYRKTRILFISQKYPKYTEKDLLEYDVIISDDLFSGYSCSEYIQNLILVTFENTRKKVLITSNVEDMNRIIKQATLTGNTERFLDRAKNTFHSMVLHGESHRRQVRSFFEEE